MATRAQPRRRQAPPDPRRGDPRLRPPRLPPLPRVRRRRRGGRRLRARLPLLRVEGGDPQHALHRALADHARRDRRDRPQAGVPARDKLYLVASFIIDSYRHDPDLMKVIIVEVTRAANSFGRVHLATIREAYEGIAQIVEGARAEGSFKPDISAEFAAMCFYGAIEQLLSGWIFDLLPKSEEEFEQRQGPGRRGHLRRARGRPAADAASLVKSRRDGQRARQAPRVERPARRRGRARDDRRQPHSHRDLGKSLQRGSTRRLMEAATATSDRQWRRPRRTPSSRTDDAFAEHPELFVGAALVGGLVLAQLLKRLGDGRRLSGRRNGADKSLGDIVSEVSRRPRSSSARRSSSPRRRSREKVTKLGKGAGVARRGGRVRGLRADLLPGRPRLVLQRPARRRTTLWVGFLDRLRVLLSSSPALAGFLGSAGSRAARRPRPTWRSRRPSARARCSSSRRPARPARSQRRPDAASARPRRSAPRSRRRAGSWRSR